MSSSKAAQATDKWWRIFSLARSLYSSSSSSPFLSLARPSSPIDKILLQKYSQVKLIKMRQLVSQLISPEWSRQCLLANHRWLLASATYASCLFTLLFSSLHFCCSRQVVASNIQLASKTTWLPRLRWRWRLNLANKSNLQRLGTIGGVKFETFRMSTQLACMNISYSSSLYLHQLTSFIARSWIG